VRGVLNVNKPSGISSYDVIRRLKPLLRSSATGRGSAIPVGHAGTLDPLASGVLLVLVGEATKTSRFLLDLPKEYMAGVLLGKRTDTDDVTGTVVEEKPVPAIDEEKARAALSRFLGVSEQTPPAYSAIKQDGRALYHLARQGLEVKARPRPVEMHELDLTALKLPRLSLRCRVSSGTYVRGLARDLGTALGTVGTLESLVRTAVGPFRVEEAVELHELEQATLSRCLRPVAGALSHLPSYVLSAEQARRLGHGLPVECHAADAAAAMGVARTEDDRFLAVVRSRAGELRTERVIYAD
jgi:tRNA pseudouridine55 synthase